MADYSGKREEERLIENARIAPTTFDQWLTAA
jgi:hypothetical protein